MIAISIEDLAEGTTETETPIAVWLDDETNEIIFQYGYASVSMPVEDFRDFQSMLESARDKLEFE
ncbi:MAG: hypothetical protein V5A87_05120 [Candidatus Bipolaricaulota bacterium]|nr:hypothetical protein [Candidatus Bipolaricaulota bacterium]MBS3791455.1 hypothetical protein [Candidatus Bipolaricaulota bacterium]